MVKAEGTKPYVADQFTAVSDGRYPLGKVDESARLRVQPPRQVDAPITFFYNPAITAATQDAVAVGMGRKTRGHATQSRISAVWSEPEPAAGTRSPGSSRKCSSTACPSFPYEQILHRLCCGCFTARLRSGYAGTTNSGASIDTQLTYSLDGLSFPTGACVRHLIGLNEPGLAWQWHHLSKFPWLRVNDELRIYSSSSKHFHMQYGQGFFQPKGEDSQPARCSCTRLRKDGFMYLASGGNWANLHIETDSS